MRYKTLTIFGAMLVAGATMQASERHHARKAPASISQSVRDSNAAAWPGQQSEPDWVRYQNGALSAPAGR